RLGALLPDRIRSAPLGYALAGGRTLRAYRGGLSGHRLHAPGEGLPCLEHGHHAGGQPVRGRPRFCGEAREAGGLHWKGRAGGRSGIRDRPTAAPAASRRPQRDRARRRAGADQWADRRASDERRIRLHHRTQHRVCISPLGSRGARHDGRDPGFRPVGARRGCSRAALRSDRSEDPGLSERDELLSFAMELADEADKIAMRYFRRDLRIDRKPDRTFVTQADTAVEKALRERIEHRYPGHGVLAEEFGDRTAKQETRWIIDPIDATHSYMRGIPVFAI